MQKAMVIMVEEGCSAVEWLNMIFRFRSYGRVEVRWE